MRRADTDGTDALSAEDKKSQERHWSLVSTANAQIIKYDVHEHTKASVRSELPNIAALMSVALDASRQTRIREM
jgi:hypothetical protein